MKKFSSIFLAMLVFFTLNLSADAASSKVWWDGAELKPGQIGRVTIIKGATLFKLENTYLQPIRQLEPGEVFRVYKTKTVRFVPLYGLGGNYFVAQEPGTTPGYLRYETPSKAKLALVNKK